MRFCLLLVTAPGVVVARKIARALLKNRAAACLNIISRVESHYWWQGKIESAHEGLLVIKTTQAKVDQAIRLIRRMHPYEVPEIIVLPIRRGLPAYLRWIRETTDSHEPRRKCRGTKHR